MTSRGSAGSRRSPREASSQRYGQPLLPRWARLTRFAVIVVVVLFVATRLVGLFGGDDPKPGVAGVPVRVADRAPGSERTVDVHAGYGTWVDVYDYGPSGESAAPVTPATIGEMHQNGVRTLYLQAAQYGENGTARVTDPGMVAQMLVHAHQAGMRVVGWYLPRFTDVDRDLAYLAAISDFEVLGHRFDGVAVDIEWTAGVPDPADRSDALVELSERLSEREGDDSLGAIVLSPVHLEEVNIHKWPGFPWRDLAGLYDVWLPMSYWTERLAESGFQDGWTYTAENVRRLRHNLDDSDATIHVIGGIGDQVTPEQADRFVRALERNDAVGASIYDWTTLDPAVSSQIATGIHPRDD